MRFAVSWASIAFALLSSEAIAADCFFKSDTCLSSNYGHASGEDLEDYRRHVIAHKGTLEKLHVVRARIYPSASLTPAASDHVLDHKSQNIMYKPEERKRDGEKKDD